MLDAAHALKEHGVNRYAHRSKPNLAEERRRAETAAPTKRRRSTICGAPSRPRQGRGRRGARTEKQRQDMQRKLGLPEENLLYFIEKRAPRLEDWQRELIRIVRNVSQYFYPQKQTQMMNEGCATFCPLRDHEPAARPRADHRRRDARIPPFAFERRVPAGVRRPALQRAQPLCARLRDDERHQAHLRRSRTRKTASGSPTSPAPATPTACCATPGPITATRALSCNT